MKKELGKITSAEFGFTGRDDCAIGLTVTLSFGGGYATVQTRCAWAPQHIKVTDTTKWTEKDRDEWFAEIVRYTSSLLYQAKVKNVKELVGKPVEVTTNGNSIVNWRILEEVL